MMIIITEETGCETFINIEVDEINQEIIQIGFEGKGSHENTDSGLDDEFIDSIYDVVEQIKGEAIPEDERYITPSYLDESCMIEVGTSGIILNTHEGYTKLTNQKLNLLHGYGNVSLNDVLHNFYQRNKANIHFESDEKRKAFMRVINKHTIQNQKLLAQARVYGQLIGQALRSTDDCTLKSLPLEILAGPIGNHLVNGDKQRQQYLEQNLATKPEYNKQIIRDLINDILTMLDYIKPGIRSFFKDHHAEAKADLRNELKAQIHEPVLKTFVNSLCKFSLSVMNGNSKQYLTGLLKVLDENQEAPNKDESDRIRELGKENIDMFKTTLREKICKVAFKPNLEDIHRHINLHG